MNELKLSLKAARVNAGIEAKEFSKKIKKSPAWITLIETNQRRISALDFLKWCELCNISPSQIFLPEHSTKSISRYKKHNTSLSSAKKSTKRIKK